MSKNQKKLLVDVSYSHIPPRGIYKDKKFEMHPSENIQGDGAGEFSISKGKPNRLRDFVSYQELAELFAIDAFKHMNLKLRMEPSVEYHSPPGLQPSISDVKTNSQFGILVLEKQKEIKLYGFSEGLYSKLNKLGITLSGLYYPNKIKIAEADGIEDFNKSNVEISNDNLLIKKHKVSLEELENRLAMQREIGALGEDVAYRYECSRLHFLKCDNPVAHIKVETKDNVGAGYDMKSHFNGETRYIEVKSSVVNNDSFYLSENERFTLEKLGLEAYIYLVKVDKNDSKNSQVTKEIPNPIADPKLTLEPVAYMVSLAKDV